MNPTCTNPFPNPESRGRVLAAPPPCRTPFPNPESRGRKKKLDAVGKGQTSSKKEVLPNKGQKGGQKGSRILP